MIRFFARSEAGSEEARGYGRCRNREFKMCAYDVPTFFNRLDGANLKQP